MNSVLDKLYAILRRDLLTSIRHRSGFVLTLVGLLTQLAAFYFLLRAIGPSFRPNGVEYFAFLLVGTRLYTFSVMSRQAFLETVQEAQCTGTMEVLMTTSTAPAELVILSFGLRICREPGQPGDISAGWRGNFSRFGPCQPARLHGCAGGFSGPCLGAWDHGGCA
jgi:hypothetical protein